MTKSVCRPCGELFPVSMTKFMCSWGAIQIGPTSQGVMAPSSDFLNLVTFLLQLFPIIVLLFHHPCCFPTLFGYLIFTQHLFISYFMKPHFVNENNIRWLGMVVHMTNNHPISLYYTICFKIKDCQNSYLISNNFMRRLYERCLEMS